ncbi:hypothetical protein H17ap60334_07853 [Thermosipho africanus H17ap60334]|jgi:hypothetical protein|uniref:winged helix-turn-helix domain-containing protein n=1 Tax=Thermosipho africanus TaxID=2421 RepID=UPI00028D9299|nr:winged helix-turn-helix domain-containing protein [Thermosipho africanus]EKF49053.1 hypothetical protein H17ap60334_07853 [Thermosipho africanus H17ap60334]
MGNSVDDAFEILLEEIDNIYKNLVDEVEKFLKSKDFEKVEELLGKSKKIQEFSEKLKFLQSEWKTIFSNQKSLLLNKNTKNIKRGLKTPQSAYVIPILESLIELGGRAKMDKVISRVYEKMKNKFNEYDLGKLNSGVVRWKNTAQWARFEMIKDGLLSSDSPRGIWEITEKGKEYYKNHSNRFW